MGWGVEHVNCVRAKQTGVRQVNIVGARESCEAIIRGTSPGSVFLQVCEPKIDTKKLHCWNGAGCSDITNDQLGISDETGHGGANLYIY